MLSVVYIVPEDPFEEDVKRLLDEVVRDLLALRVGWVVVEGAKLARAMNLVHMPEPVMRHNGRLYHAKTRQVPVQILGNLEFVDYEDFARAVAARLPAGTTHICRIYITATIPDEGHGKRFVSAFCAKVN